MRPMRPRRGLHSAPSTSLGSWRASMTVSTSMSARSWTCRPRSCWCGRTASGRRSISLAMTCTCGMGCGSRFGLGRSGWSAGRLGRGVRRRVLSPGAARPPVAPALRLTLPPPDGPRRHPPTLGPLPAPPADPATAPAPYRMPPGAPSDSRRRRPGGVRFGGWRCPSSFAAGRRGRSLRLLVVRRRWCGGRR